jgi:hypothetical protein
MGTLTNFPSAVSLVGKSATNVPSTTGCHLCPKLACEEDKVSKRYFLRECARRKWCLTDSYVCDSSEERRLWSILDAFKDIRAICAANFLISKDTMGAADKITHPIAATTESQAV